MSLYFAQIPDWLAISSSAVQMFFWASASTIAILSFIQARKVLFQPLETEIFRGQFHQLNEVMKFISSVKGFDRKSTIEEELKRFRNINYWLITDYFQIAYLKADQAEIKDQDFYEVDVSFNSGYQLHSMKKISFGKIETDRSAWKLIDDWHEFKLLAAVPLSIDDSKKSLSTLIAESYLLPEQAREMLRKIRKLIAVREYESFVFLREFMNKLPDIQIPQYDLTSCTLEECLSNLNSPEDRREFLRKHFEQHFVFTCKKLEGEDTKIFDAIEELEKYVRSYYKIDKMFR
ncbi:MAG: hypothetical protein AAGH67_03705 [Cyanobacteria bacterium P01_H01_bin.162]